MWLTACASFIVPYVADLMWQPTAHLNMDRAKLATSVADTPVVIPAFLIALFVEIAYHMKEAQR